jgi:hypothetical protein
VIQGGNQDSWIYIWGTVDFSSQQAYKAIISFSTTPKNSLDYGNLHIRQSTYSFFGCYFKTDYTQENY